jgi:hypothetical protein
MQLTNDPVAVSSMSAAQRKEVLAQMELLLASSLFRQSKRYPAFLRYVVESTIQRSDDDLKERTIGIEVFGRVPNYDTSQDPTVRLTAAEVRKRLAQYYQQPEHAERLHIALNPGSYVPIFLWPVSSPAPTPMSISTPQSAPTSVRDEPESLAHGEPQAVPDQLPPVPGQPLQDPTRVEQVVTSVSLLGRTGLRRLIEVAAGLALLGGLSWVAYSHLADRMSDRDVWAPIVKNANPVSVVVADLSKAGLTPQVRETEKTSVLSHIRESRTVDFNDSVALAQLSGLLGRWKKPYTVVLSSEVSYEDLQSGPSLLIGAVDNPWTMRFLEPLPYSVARQGNSMTYGIVSKKNPALTSWSIDLAQPYEKVEQDFGVVVRETDTMTGKPVLILAGLGQNATAAGVRLLTDPALEQELVTQAPKDWSGRNLEVVFSTQIIDDKFGPPIIVAREYW